MNSIAILPLLAALALLAPSAYPDEKEPSADAVKAVRAILGAKRAEERDKLTKELFERKDLDWAALKKGLAEGPYYRKPLVTAYGERHSRKHFDLVFSGEDGKPRGFSMYVPKSYDAKKPIPLLLYLHHAPQDPGHQRGMERAGVAVFKFRKMCEEQGILFVAPYTSKGAEWWTPQGKKLVAWTLTQVRKRYRIDDDRVGLMGALGGGDSVWYLGQEMPGTWSVLMPMTGDPYEITAIVRPLFLGTLDRMDILMGVPGKTQSQVGDKDVNRFLTDLKPLLGQRMRITASIWPRAQGDFRYLGDITPQVASFLLARKRKPYANEVDVETEKGRPLRSLWLRNDGWFEEGQTPHNLGSTLLKWTPPARREPEKKLGVSLEARPKWPLGLVITATPGAAKNERIFSGDVLLEADGKPLKTPADVKAVLKKKQWKEEVVLLLAREVKESKLAQFERNEKLYARYREKIKELRDAGKPIPRNLWEELQESEESGCGPGDEGEGEDEGEDDGEIIESGDDEIIESGDDAAGRGKAPAKKEKTVIRVFQRWVRLRRPVGPLVRRDFGAGVDRSHAKVGVKLGSVMAGSLAARSGLKPGDIIVQVGDTEVENAGDIERFFATCDPGDKPFAFEKSPEPFVDFTVRRQNPDGTFTAERQVTVRWEPVKSSRVDARWDKKENTLFVLARKASGFTLYFTDELVKPGKEFYLFINDVPYRDLVDPAGAPDYPRIEHGSDPLLKDELYRMRRGRAKVEGWTPDLKWALEEYLEHRDRRQVYGAYRSFDLTKMNPGFRKAKDRGTGGRAKKGERIKKAYDEHKGGQ